MTAFAGTSDAPGAPTESGFSRAFWIPIAGAFVVLQLALFWIEWWPAPRRLWGDENLYSTAAARIAVGLPADVDLLWSDFYAHALAPFEKMQRPEMGRLGVVAVQLALLLAAAASLRGLVRRISGSPRAGDAAAALLVLDPQIAAFAFYLWPEILHLTCFLAALWLLVAHGERWIAAIGAGALLGIALLAKSVLLPFLPVIALAVVAESGWRKGLSRIALAAAVAGMIVAPKVAENGRRHGLYTIADSSRFNLWVGLNDRSRRDIAGDIAGREYGIWRASAPDFGGRDAVLGEKIAAFVRDRGLFRVVEDQLAKQYFRLFDKDSFFTNQLPGGAIQMQGYGYAAVPPLLATALRAWAYAFHALVIGLACVGLALAASSAARGASGPRPVWVFVGLAWIAYTLLLFFGLHVKTRYRVQLWPAFDAFAGAAAAFLSARAISAPEPRWRAPAPLATAGGVLAALFLLFLSFGGPLLG